MTVERGNLMIRGGQSRLPDSDQFPEPDLASIPPPAGTRPLALWQDGVPRMTLGRPHKPGIGLENSVRPHVNWSLARIASMRDAWHLPRAD